MFCGKCGTELSENEMICPNCGVEINHLEKCDVVTQSKKKEFGGWKYLSLASLFCGCVTLIKGIDKMVNYENGESYPYDLVNAYVGGDAYNYIINGTYATAFFALTAMFVLAAIGMMALHYLAAGKKND